MLEIAATTTTRTGTATGGGEIERAEHAPSPEAAAEEASGMMQTMSRMIYSGSYAVAYGVVYAAVFFAQSLPHENPVMHGFHDGGKAAMDELSRS